MSKEIKSVVAVRIGDFHEGVSNKTGKPYYFYDCQVIQRTGNYTNNHFVREKPSEILKPGKYSATPVFRSGQDGKTQVFFTDLEYVSE